MTKTLIVPLDGSPFAERALPVASGCARRLHGKVIALATEWDGEFERPQRYLDELIERVDGDITPLLVRVGDAPLAIEYAVRETPDRVACMTTHGRGGLRWAMLGSVAEEVVRRVDRPVILVGRHCEPTRVDATELLCCWDGTDASNRVLSDVCSWAKALDLRVRLLFVAHPLDVETATHADAFFAEAAGKVEAEGLHVETNLLRGDYTAGMIADFAESRLVAMIAMASRARTGVARVALGSTTMAVVGAAPCPVLVSHGPV
jgi:nucleotide-binding universal stress UspA family protein